MAGRLLVTCIRQSNRQMATYAADLSKIGNREIVGHGYNGNPTYLDRVDFPMPAIRFKENTSDIQALKEKEKGDWKKLSIEEKKALYRASFCQTFAEMDAPSGEWKSIMGWTLITISVGIWFYVFFRQAVYPPLPESFDDEHRLAQMERMIQLDVQPITGISSFKYQK